MNSALARAPVMYEQIGGEEPLRRLVDLRSDQHLSNLMVLERPA